MKVITKYIVLLIAIFTINSCMDDSYIEVNPNFILSFQRDGETTAFAGTPFYVLPTVDAEFLTLYNGKEGHVWGEEGATGTDLNKADSIEIKYDSIGQFKVSLVATSIGKLGEKITKLAKTVEVNVVDNRNLITLFSMNNMAGLISDNEISFSMPDNITSFNFKPYFSVASNSDSCIVSVDGVKQISGVSEHVFTPSVPITYTVKSPNGTIKTYSVLVTTYASSSACKLLKFSLSSGIGTNAYGEVGVIDEANKTITLNVNYATDLNSVRFKPEYSFASTLKIGSTSYSATKGYNLSSSTAIKVTAEDKETIGLYSLILTTESPILDFTFAGFNPAPIRVIDHALKTITIDLAQGTDISKLKAIWTGTAGYVGVKNGTTDYVQTNGVTENDFTTPQKYTFYKGNGSANLTQLVKGDEYTVYVSLK